MRSDEENDEYKKMYIMFLFKSLLEEYTYIFYRNNMHILILHLFERTLTHTHTLLNALPKKNHFQATHVKRIL